MADTQYDLPPKIIRLFHEKEKIRNRIRQMITERETNPHIKMGHPHDVAITRYHSLFVYRSNYVRANPRNLSVFFFTIVLPVGLIFNDIYKTTNKKEALFRSGKVAYEDRCFKCIV